MADKPLSNRVRTMPDTIKRNEFNSRIDPKEESPRKVNEMSEAKTETKPEDEQRKARSSGDTRPDTPYKTALQIVGEIRENSKAIWTRVGLVDKIPPIFGMNDETAADTLVAMAQALAGSNKNLTPIIQLASSLYAYIHSARVGGFVPHSREIWIVKRRCVNRHAQQIDEGILTRDNVIKAADIAVRYMYSEIPYFREKDEAYFRFKDELDQALTVIDREIADPGDFSGLCRDIGNLSNKGSALYTERKPAWAAECLEELAKRVEPYAGNKRLIDGRVYVFGTKMDFLREIALSRQPEYEFKGRFKDIVWMDIRILQIMLPYGSALVECGLYQEAVNVLDRLHKKEPMDANVLLEKAFALTRLQMPDEAEQSILDAFALSHNNRDRARAFRAYGSKMIDRNRWDLAMACFQKSLTIEPDSGTAASEIEFIKQKSSQKPLNADQIDRLIMSSPLGKFINDKNQSEKQTVPVR